MKKLLGCCLSAVLLLSACSTVPMVGRKQLNLVNDAQVLSSSLTQYNAYMKTAKKSNNKQLTAQVVRVGQRIAKATEAYLNSHGLNSDFNWEFNLVQSADVNAFCMPGGKIVVYDGLLKLVNSDADLAVVLGHEVAHAVAKHSNERMSQQMLAQYGGQILGQMLANKSVMTQAVASKVYGLGAQTGVLLPFSRKHELEADHMGLILMAMAGYNPQTAVSFWKKMAQQGNSSTPAFLRSHPTDAKRISEIQKEMPQALKYYKK